MAAASASAFSAHGSVEQLYVTGLAPNAQMSLLRSSGETVSTQTADSAGGLLFRTVTPEAGYRVRLASNGEESGPITVYTQAAEPWDPSIFNQGVPDSGYSYLTTRDGTQLAIDVHLPATTRTGTYPTLIKYAGYGYANPAGPESGLAELANLMGFAVVDVNMRGTGCSGGAFDYFEPLENLDAYDVIETIAEQPWVLHHKVGMFGISYGGISQLFAAQLDPHALAAIAPLSVLDATSTTLYPGGASTRVSRCPGPRKGSTTPNRPVRAAVEEHWACEQVQKGDTTCAANQDLHAEAANLLESIKENALYNPPVADPLDPVTFVNKINSSDFMACQWEDEQTGGHCADLAERFHQGPSTSGSPSATAPISTRSIRTRSTVSTTSCRCTSRASSPYKRAAAVHAAAPIIYQSALGVPSGNVVFAAGLTRSRNCGDTQGAQGIKEAPPEVRVLFDNGAGTSPSGSTTPGDPYPGFEQSFSSFPIPGTTARSVVPRAGRHAQRTACGSRRCRLLHVECERHAADGLLEQHGPGRAVGRRRRLGMELDTTRGG